MKKYILTLFIVFAFTHSNAQVKIAYVDLQNFLKARPDYQQAVNYANDISKNLSELQKQILDKYENATTDEEKTEGYEKMSAYSRVAKAYEDTVNMNFANLETYYREAMGKTATSKGFKILLDASNEDTLMIFWASPALLNNSKQNLLKDGIKTIEARAIFESSAELKAIQKKAENLYKEVEKDLAQTYERFSEVESKMRDEVYVSFDVDLREVAVFGDKHIEPGLLKKINNRMAQKRDANYKDYSKAKSALEEAYKSNVAEISAEQGAVVAKIRKQIIKTEKTEQLRILLNLNNSDVPELIWVAPSIVQNPKNELLQYVNN